MTERLLITNEEVEDAVGQMVKRAKELHDSFSCRVYGVPRGGIPIAYLFKAVAERDVTYRVTLVDDPGRADIIVDDVKDSGSTEERFRPYDVPFLVAFDKGDDNRWYVFPWEVSDDYDSSDLDTVKRMLQRIGEDPTREGLLETPTRVVKAWEEWFGGYDKDPAEVLKVFEDGAEGVDEMVLETDIPVYSHCEHHVAPIFGVAHIAYIPDGKVLGLSKLVRLVDVFARRLQVQERLTNQIADSLAENLKPKGVGVVLQCRHMCMESRGVNSPGVVTTTSALRGALKEEHDARAEFMSLIRMTRKGGPL